MKISLQNFDLNLLNIFNALMVEHSVSKAAEQVGLSQSAMSHALNRLRVLLDDPILVKTQKGMLPTPRALAMEIPIREALTKIQQNLHTPEAFDPSIDHASFIIYGPEYFETICLPILISYLQNHAPNVRIKAGIATTSIEDVLTSGEVDYAIGIDGIHEIPNRLRSQHWLNDKMTCVVRKENITVGDRITLDEYINTHHIYHSTLGTPYAQNFFDKWLEHNKISRHIATVVPGYLSAAMITEITDYILTMPLHLARKLVKKMDLRIVKPPKNFPNYRLNLIWHPIYENDPAQVWFREKLLNLPNQELY